MLSNRADKAESHSTALSETLRAYESAVGDKRAIQGALDSERAQTAFLRERVTELERTVIAFADRRIEATVVGQTGRKDAKEEPLPPSLTRWGAASGTYWHVPPRIQGSPEVAPAPKDAE